MIRELTEHDLEASCDVLSKFYEESVLPGSFKPEVFVNNWRAIISAGSGSIFGHFQGGKADGFIGVIFYPDVNDGQLVASEAFWFVDPASRGSGIKLLKRCEDAVKAKGCKRFTMVHLFNHERDKLSRLYVKWGFSPTEVHYTKVFNN